VRAILLGFCIGFMSSIPPLGPGALLLLRRGLEGRTSAGLAAAAGGATADAIYCALAVVGLSYLFWRYPDIAASMRWLGIAILVLLGIWFLTRTPEPLRNPGKNGFSGDWPRHAVLGFSLAAFNPTLLITWTAGVAMIASFGGSFFAGAGRYTFPIGVAMGDVGWAMIALFLYRRLGSHLPQRLLSRLMRGIGFMLLLLAVVLAVRASAPS
jgi:threonine/homoserine/homoserine lactone efflux protein